MGRSTSWVSWTLTLCRESWNLQLIGVKGWPLLRHCWGPQSFCGYVDAITATEKPSRSWNRKGENLRDWQQKNKGNKLHLRSPGSPKTGLGNRQRTFVWFASLSLVTVSSWTVDTCAAATAATRHLFNAGAQYVGRTSAGFCLCTLSDPSDAICEVSGTSSSCVCINK